MLLLLTPKTKIIRTVTRRWVPDAAGDGVALPGPETTSPVNLEPPVQRPVGRRRSVAFRVVDSVVVPTLIIAGLISGYIVSGSDWSCTTLCHADNHTSDQWATSHGRGLSCVDCHEDGALGVVGNTSSRLLMVARQFNKTAPAFEDAVSSRACVRCHEPALRTVSTDERGVRMSHEQPLRAGWACTDCHLNAGHSTAKLRSLGMRPCRSCHDGTRASSKCSTCHVSTELSGRVSSSRPDTSGPTIGSGVYQYSPVGVTDSNCGGCHTLEKQCDPCHTTRMPHSERFVSGYHAKQAAFEKKKQCWRCHDRRDCDTCHSPFETGHADNWKSAHQSAPWEAGCGCHARQQNQHVAMCVFCHDDAPASP